MKVWDMLRTWVHRFESAEDRSVGVKEREPHYCADCRHCIPHLFFGEPVPHLALCDAFTEILDSPAYIALHGVPPDPRPLFCETARIYRNKDARWCSKYDRAYPPQELIEILNTRTGYTAKVNKSLWDAYDKRDPDWKSLKPSALATAGSPTTPARPNLKGDLMRYTSEQIIIFRHFAREAFGIHANGPVDIHIDQDGMYAEQPGDVTRTRILDPERDGLMLTVELTIRRADGTVILKMTSAATESLDWTAAPFGGIVDGPLTLYGFTYKPRTRRRSAALPASTEPPDPARSNKKEKEG